MELVQIYFKKTKQLLPTNTLKLFQFFSQIFFLKIFPPGSAYLMLKNTVALEKTTVVPDKKNNKVRPKRLYWCLEPYQYR